jgi:DNA-directed RNA polymerase I, II, and III subunit RPABC2
MSSLRRSNKTSKDDDAEDADDIEKETKEEGSDEDDYDDDNADAEDVEEKEANDETDNEDDEEDEEEEDDEPNEDATEEGSNGEKDEDEDNEDDEEEEEDSELVESDYLQKFSNEKNKNYIKDFHPELSSHNYEEVKLLSIITRDKNGIIIDSLHKTIPILTKFEKTRILGQRAKQIDSGARPFVDVPKDIIEGYLIAKLELAEKKIPFIIKRPIPNGGCEYWNVNDLEDL